jgi:SNF2 family DNA or RNA helicase
LTQISVSPQLIGDPEIDSGKYRKLVELVDKELHTNPQKKLIVWSAFTKSSNHIAELLSRWGLVRVDGTNANSEVRQEAILKFQTDPNTRIFLGNPSAAGAGITLTAADTAIYVSISNQAAPYMQSIDRIHRIGQTAKTVRYVLLVSKGTLDQNDVEKLSRKQANQSWILGDPSISGLDLAGALAELG